jgi:hypothetical protein
VLSRTILAKLCHCWPGSSLLLGQVVVGTLAGYYAPVVIYREGEPVLPVFYQSSKSTNLLAAYEASLMSTPIIRIFSPCVWARLTMASHGLYSGRMEFYAFLVGLQLQPDSTGIVPYLRRAGLAQARYLRPVRVFDLSKRRREHSGHRLAWLSGRKSSIIAPSPLSCGHRKGSSPPCRTQANAL